MIPFVKSRSLYGNLHGTSSALPEMILKEVKNANWETQEIKEESNPEYINHDQSLVVSILSDEVFDNYRWWPHYPTFVEHDSIYVFSNMRS